MASSMARRGVLAAGAALAASGLIRPRGARAEKALNLVLESEVVILDPYFTTAAITRTFSHHVFDTLFAMDQRGMIKPQMVEAWETAADGLHWEFRLREGLPWHDGGAVTAADCVASLNRWMPRDPLGRMLLAASAGIEARDARSFAIQLKQPFPMMLDVLGKPNAPVPAMMPERLARTPGDQRIAAPIGSGPFRFPPDLWRPGSVMVLERFPDYLPRREPPDFLAGGKVVKVDQLNLRVLTDQVTGANALIQGEVDYMQYLPFDLIPRLERARGVRLLGLGGLHQFQGNFRLNHAHPPFDDPAVRRVLWKLIDQDSVLTAIGVPAQFRAPTCSSFWMCDTPFSTDAGAAGARLDLDASREELRRTNYRGEPVVFLEVSGSISQTAAHILAENMKRVGFTVDEQVMDWGTVLARRARKESWSLFAVYSNGVDMYTPLNHFYVASTCADYPGWSCDVRIPPLLTRFAQAPDAAARASVAREIQVIAYELTPSLMWGQFTIPAGYRTTLKDLVQSSFPIFWAVDRT